jgi:hypothetical protein
MRSKADWARLPAVDSESSVEGRSGELDSASGGSGRDDGGLGRDDMRAAGRLPESGVSKADPIL